jgi:hypothetical protein
MHIASRFVGAAVAVAMVSLAGCGGGGGDSEGPEPEAAAFLADAADAEQAAGLQADMEQAPLAALGCRAGRTCRLSGSVVDRGSGEFIIPGCSPVTTSSSGRAILNVSFTGSLQQAGRYRVRVSSGTYRFETTVSSMTCQTPGGPITVPGNTSSNVVAAQTGNVIVVSDGHNLTVTGTMVGTTPPGCTGGNRYVGDVIGLSNPMVTLHGSMACTIGGGTFRMKSTVKLIGTL